MKKILSILIAIGLGLNLQAQICPLQEAVDFSATDLHGNKIHLFGILDSGQALFIHFFINYNADPQLVPFVTEAFHTMGCNTHDVFFMEISHRLTHQECQEWADQHHVDYPSIGIEGGSCDIYDTYGITASPTFILIMPDRSITIHGVMELYPFSANDIVNALAQYGNLQPDDCTGTLAVETDTVFISESLPGRIDRGKWQQCSC